MRTCNLNFELLIRIFIIIVGLLALNARPIYAQTSSEHTALNNLSKKKWSRSYAQLKKAINKDSLNVIAEYVYALFFFSPDNPDFNLDSASHYVARASRHLMNANFKQRDRIRRFPIDSVNLTGLINRIDSAAFEFAKQINTEQAYLYFLSRHAKSRYFARAVELRDEAAYLDALRQNTYEGFSGFLKKYPNANRSGEANKRYEKLLFETKTHDKLLTSYEKFLIEFPETKYRTEVERNIFEIATASGEQDKIIEFLKKYPNSSFSNKARDILFHVIYETDNVFPDIILNDSLKHITTLANAYLVPFLREGKFGFMNDTGVEIIPSTFQDIPKKYLCGNITEDIIIFSDRILAKDGSLVYAGDIREVDDLGFGFLKISTANNNKIVHKSGFFIVESFLDDAKVVDGKFLALKNKKWSLFTLAGRQLTTYEWDDIYSLNNIIVFKRDRKLILATAAQVGLLANQQSLNTADLFDEVRPWKNNLIWARARDFEGIFDQALRVTIPFEKQLLMQVFFGAVGSSLAGAKVYNLKGDELGIFQNITVNPPWVAVKQASGWRFFDVTRSTCQSVAYDSISFTGSFAVGHSGDSVNVYFTPQKMVRLRKCRYEFIPGKDTTSYLSINDGDKKTIYNSKGEKLFAGGYSTIQYGGEGIFVVSKKEKKGLVAKNGTIVLPIEFDAIGSVLNHTFSLLKNKKFGLYNLSQDKQIKPQYDKNVISYNDKLVIGLRNGLYGLVDWNGKPLTNFEFEDIRYWNDTAAFIKKNSQWMLLNMLNQQVVFDEIANYQVISTDNDEILAIFDYQNEFGVMSNKRGLIIPNGFSDIRNIGSASRPFYFTEKHIEEASMFIVTYYSSDGRLIIKQLYEQDDYDRLYCSNN